MAVKYIAAKSKIHPGKLGMAHFGTFVSLWTYGSGFPCTARALRLLATHHVFAEISPDVFVNNSLSSVLDTGKSTESLFTQYVATVLH